MTYTKCPNNFDAGQPHDFDAYTPFEDVDRSFERIMFCRKCGEVRPLTLPIHEDTADERAVIKRTPPVRWDSES